VQVVTDAFNRVMKSGRDACMSGGEFGCIGAPYKEATDSALPTPRGPNVPLEGGCDSTLLFAATRGD
jgi:hypothetical protein